MWTIAKIDKKNIINFQNEIRSKLNNVIFYKPEFLKEKIVKNKIVSFKVNLFNEYIFCYHDAFKNSQTINHIRFTRGLKYFLSNYKSTQSNIIKTINFCKSRETKEGFIKEKFFKDFSNNKLKFLFGPLRDLVFNIEELDNKKIYFRLGKLKVSTNLS